MPHQNRVTPFGTIEALPGRGAMLGNRGVVHDASGSIVRAWQTRRWICCVLEFKGRHREVMEPNRWTHLFFLDEATAFAAGHRPCAECRRADYVRFRSLWEEIYGPVATVADIDSVLHAARLNGKSKRMYRAQCSTLPDGTFIVLEDQPWLVRGNRMHRWSNKGYVEVRARADAEVDVLTPEPFVRLFTAGYRASMAVSPA